MAPSILHPGNGKASVIKSKIMNRDEDLSASDIGSPRKRRRLSSDSLVEDSTMEHGGLGDEVRQQDQTADDPIIPLNKIKMASSRLHVPTKSSFTALKVQPWLVASLATMAIKRPTAIQQACIPEILNGRDCIGGSKTGSGKTVAFAVPIIQKWAEDPLGIFAVVLTPTRELALQIFEQFKAIAAPQSLKPILVTGGADMREQALELSKRPHVVIATPGRLADHIHTSGEDTICGLRRARFVVLDEADRLLAEGHGSMLPDVQTCLAVLPPKSERQTCLFTATVTDEVRALKESKGTPGKPPLFVCEVDTEDLAIPSTLKQLYLKAPIQHREAFLHILLLTPANENKSVIVFCNKTSTATLLEHTLRLLDHRVTALHANLQQRDRVANLGRFRAGPNIARILVATDLAARGLDIPEVALVVNFDVPRDADTYIHRVGRTARAGRGGESVTMVFQARNDEVVERIERIEQRVGKQMVEYEEEGVSIEGRVIRDGLKPVGEKKREAMLQIEEGRNVKGKRQTTKLKPVGRA